MELDEFSFPATNPDNTPIDSPPLWRLSPTASPTPSYEEAVRKDLKLTAKVDENGNFYSRKSCSFLEGRCLMKRSKMCGNTTNTSTIAQDPDQDQEKMDMLWEDLNYEELFKSKRDLRKIDYHGNFPRGSDEVMEFGCVPAPFKLIRTSNMKNGNSKKTSLLVLVKVLRRFFMLHQSSKKRSR